MKDSLELLIEKQVKKSSTGKMKILIMGLSGSGKTTVAEPLADLIGGVHLNADAVRTKYDDWDFTAEGRLRQAERMLHLADGVEMAGKIAIADFIAPTEQALSLIHI